jgi:hypothetical protein
MLFPLKAISQFLAMILNNLTGLTEFLTKTASALPYASIENVGMTNIECILLSLTIFLFTYYLLKKKSISVVWPMAAMIIYLLAGTVREISTRMTNEIIVYNTPGHSTIGVRTGKILNVYSDTAFAGAELKKHCSTLGLKMQMNTLGIRNTCIMAGRTRILIAGSTNKMIMDSFSPDLVILTGSKPKVEFTPDPGLKSVLTLIAAEGSPDFRTSLGKKPAKLYPVYIVKKSGAFIRRI